MFSKDPIVSAEGPVSLAAGCGGGPEAGEPDAGILELGGLAPPGLEAERAVVACGDWASPGSAPSEAAPSADQPGGGDTCTMLSHLGQDKICPIAAALRTFSFA